MKPKIPLTPGDMKSTAMSLLGALMLLNFVNGGGWPLIRGFLRLEWEFFASLSPILIPLGIGLGIGMVLRLGVAIYRAWSWKWRE